MPLYDFKCNECGNEFEDLIRNNETPVCPQCNSEKIIKKVSCCARYKPGNSEASQSYSASGSSCGGCMGGNCGSCGR